MNNSNRTFVSPACLILMGLLASQCLPQSVARADVIFFSGNPNGFQAALNTSGIQQQNVMFNDGALTLTGTTVQGLVNNSDFQLVSITSNEPLFAAGGQAPQVKPQDGALQLAVISPDPGNDSFHNVLQSLSFNLVNANNQTGTAAIQVFDVQNNSVYSFQIGNGLDFVGVLATGGTNFTSVQITSNFDILAIQQLRLGLTNSGTTSGIETSHHVMTPEPASIAVWMLLAVVGCAFCRRRQRDI